MKVLLSGYYGYNNVGDEAILKSIITALREEKPDIEIVVLSNDIEYTKKTYNVDAINRWSLKDIAKSLKNSNGLISGGGSLLQDVTSKKTVKYYVGIMALCKFLKKPYFIYSQGIGPINDKLNQKITQKYLQSASYITLRDEESKSFVKSIGVTKDIDIVPDPVMGYELDIFENEVVNSYGDNYVSISVRDWDNAKTDFLEKIKNACDDLVDKGYKVVFIPMHGKHDYKTSKSLVDKMRNECEIFPYDSSIDDKILCIKKSKLMIGMRLHALIFAATVNTPMIGISYDPKIDAFLGLVNEPVIGSVDGDWLSEDSIEKSLEVLTNYEEKVNNLKLNSNILKDNAKKTAKTALNTLQ